MECIKPQKRTILGKRQFIFRFLISGPGPLISDP